MSTPDAPVPGANDPRTDLDARLEAEIEAALGDMSLDDMLDLAAPAGGAAAATASNERQRKTGTIATVTETDVLVEFGPKSQGVCPGSFFTEKPKVGERMEFIIDRYDENEGLLVLRREGKVSKAEWESLEVGQLVEARCTGTNKGGLEMEVAGHPAFMPAGQVDLRHIADLAVFVGEKMPCEVMEIDRQRARIILSRKSHLKAERAEQRGKLMGDLEIGKQLPAVITSIQPYGAFADLGGVDGLIHISDIAWERIKEPGEKLKVGEQVNVQILKLENLDDPEKMRIGLGMKQCMDDPSVAAFEQIEEGATVSGRVTKLMDFGAFVELAPGCEGLIHISELAHERVHKVSSIVKPGEIVTVKVLSVDPASRRVSLSLKALKEGGGSGGAGGEFTRGEDPEIRKLKAQLSAKFGDNLKGGIG